MATESIGGTNLSTYGLKLAWFDGQLDLPPFKKILENHSFESELLICADRGVKIKLIGIYATGTARANALDAFKTKIKSALMLPWVFSQHNFSEICVAKEGFKAETVGAIGIEITINLITIPT